ncbi:MAG: family 20 glycosylhydrolase [Phycisphaeraceae bacterium]
MMLPMLVCLSMLAAPPLTRAADSVNLVPWPRSVQVGQGSLAVTPQARIVAADAALQPLAEILRQELLLTTGLKLATARDAPRDGDIVLALDKQLKNEDYKLTVTRRAEIRGANYNAVAMGTVTLLQALSVKGAAVTLPRLTIEDGPQVKYTGYMRDIARKPYSIASLKKLVIWCRFNKVRFFHLHMTDDNAWTFPSTAFPKLGTTNWAWHGGEKPTVYDLKELKELVAFADARGVTIVPEIETLGHSDAMRLAMPETFDLPEQPGGRARLAIVNMMSDDAYAALDVLMGEVAQVFASSPYIHIGCDETRTSVIESLPQTKEYLAAHNMPNVHHLEARHIRRLNDMINKRGKLAIAWEPRLGYGELPKNLITMPWVGNNKAADGYAKEGLQMISAPWGTEKPYHDLYNVNGSQLKNGEPLLLGATGLNWQSEEGEPGGAYLFNEPVYNPGAKRGLEDFIPRGVAVEPVIDRLLYGLTFAVEGRLDPLVFNSLAPIFTDTLTLTLASAYPAGEVRYTLDGIEPTRDSTPYTGPITLSRSATLKARWFGSDGQASPSSFVKQYRRQPTIKHDALGAAVTIEPANPGYYNGGPKSLTDGFLPAQDSFGDISLIGWEGAPIVTLDMGKAVEVRNVCAYFFRGGGGLNIPAKVTVELSNDGQTFHPAGQVTDEQGLLSRGWYVATLPKAQQARWVRLRTVAAGQWTFLAEVAVNATVPGPTLRHAALGKTVTLANPQQTKQAPYAYATHGPASFLTDGYQCNVPDWQTPYWLGFDKDLDATIDLGAVIDLREVSATFMQHAFSGVRIPQTMEVHASDDGQTFTKVATVTHEPSKSAR